MEIKIMSGMLEDIHFEDDLNGALEEGWRLRDTHVAVPEPGRADYVGIWLIAVFERDNEQPSNGTTLAT